MKTDKELENTSRDLQYRGAIELNDGDTFDWKGLEELWQNSLGGKLEKANENGKAIDFLWTNPNIEEVLENAENGALDKHIKQFKGNVLVEIFNQDSECLYQFVPSVDPAYHTRIENVGSRRMREAAVDIDVLFLTVTEEERDALLAVMKPLPGCDAILEGNITDTTYRFGRVGRYRCAHVESTIGTTYRHGATLTSKTALDELKPKAFILLGIAFGVNRIKQRLGDVIVAETVIPYEYERIGKDRVIPRGTEMPCGTVLSERFRTRRLGWKQKLGNRDVKVFQGQMLSGNKLVDNKQFRDDLVEKHPKAHGGEMEGEGGYSAAQKAKIETILVKSICDWADGHKNDNAHSFAAFTAVSLVEYILNKPDILNALGAVDIDDEYNSDISDQENTGTLPNDADDKESSAVNTIEETDEGKSHQEMQNSSIEQLTELLGNSANAYKVKKIVMGEAKKLVERLNLLDTLKTNYSPRENELEEYLTNCENLSLDTMNLFATGSCEGSDTYSAVWAESITFLAERIAPQRTVDHIRHYPALLHFYAVGIGAVKSRNYEVLAALFSQSVVKDNVYRNIPEKAGLNLVPYRVIEEDAVKSLTSAKNHKTPLNKRIYLALRPIFSEIIFSDEEFLEIFAQFEYLFALAAVHEHFKMYGDFSSPVGSYGWDHLLRNSQTYRKPWVWEQTDEQIEQETEVWTQFSRKVFQMSLEEFKDFKSKADEGVKNSIRRIWHNGLTFQNTR